MTTLDGWLEQGLAPLAVWVLLNSLDDLIIDLAWIWGLLRSAVGLPKVPPAYELSVDRAPRKRIAVFVPLWREHRVIQGMVEHNVAALRYSDYDIFIGAYPNDPRTVEAIRSLERRFERVHLALCPHDGPTSKADCLNWIYDAMIRHEIESGGGRFELVMTHDAEDLMHPESLRWVNYFAQKHQMVQIPVLPLHTPWWEFVHGVYCDEFADYQSKELQARQILGGFLPSCGVGTAFARDLIERMGKPFFDPRCLTEDYENGFRVKAHGGAQVFVPIRFVRCTPVATREYFPRRFRQAVRQRTRWLTGITLQSWEMHGWRDTLAELYWFWRDRKGLIASLMGPFLSLLCIYAIARFVVHPTPFIADGWLLAIYWLALGVQSLHLLQRVFFVTRLYGFGFAMLVPFRMVCGNLINFFAALGAIYQYFGAKLSGKRLAWLKTEHHYPGRSALAKHKRLLGEILVDFGYLTQHELDTALTSKPLQRRLGEHLISLRYITENQLFQSLSHQQGVPVERIESSAVSRRVARSLPQQVSKRYQVVAFQVEGGQLCVAGPELPTEQMHRELSRYSSLGVHFHWITTSNYQELATEFLGSDLPQMAYKSHVADKRFSG